MNKIKLIQIMKQLLELYKNNSLSEDTYKKILEGTPTPVLSDDLISYHEADFLCYLFTEIPYYRIFTYLNDFSLKLVSVTGENPDLDCVTSLIQAYYSDLISNINSRLSTEVAAHIYELAMTFYQFNHLDPEKVIPKLLKNRYNPAYLASVETAENINFEQETLPGFGIQKEMLRESISRSNYRKKNSIETNTQKLIIRYFDETTLENFLEEVKKCIESYKKQDLRDGEILGEEIMMRLRIIYNKALKSWQEKPTPIEDNFQYTLQILSN